MELFFFCSNDIFVCCKNKMRLRLVIYKISNYDSDKKSASMNFLQFEHRTSIASRPNRGNFYISRNMIIDIGFYFSKMQAETDTVDHAARVGCLQGMRGRGRTVVSSRIQGLRR